MKRKKLFCLITALTLGLSLCACAKPGADDPLQKWDCSVGVAAESRENSYVVTYYSEHLLSTTGVLTFQNRGEFDVVVHLLNTGERERTATVAPGGICAFLELTQDAEYQVGFHADMPENTRIQIMAYDGQWSEAY